MSVGTKTNRIETWHAQVQETRFDIGQFVALAKRNLKRKETAQIDRDVLARLAGRRVVRRTSRQLFIFC